jgi:hypothetical protein
MFKTLLTLAVASVVSTVAYAQTKTASLEERVAELEANSSLNVFSFRGTMITRYDDISAKQTVGVATPYDYKHLDYFRTKFSLDVDANVSRYIKVYSRFSTSKFMNSLARQDTGTPAYTVGDTTAADSYSGSGVYLEKAYADLSVPDTGLTFSVGRLPTVDGAPYDYYDNRGRLGTYPMMSYDSPLDGMSLTYRLDQYMPENQKLALRFIYVPFTQVRIGAVGSGPYTTPPTDGAAGAGNRINTNLDGYTGQVDYSLLNTGMADNFNFIAQYYNINPIAAGTDLAFGLSGLTLMADFRGIAGSGLDINLSSLMTEVHSRGGLVAAGGLGYGTTANDDKVTGTASLLALRYRFTGWHVGAEYLLGSKNTFNYEGAAKDLTSFYSTPGEGYHGFITKNFTDLLSLRLGYMLQKYKYAPITVGPTGDSDREVTTYYANLRLDF